MKILNIALILLIGNNLMGMRIGDNLPLSPAEWQSLTEMINNAREDLPQQPIRYQNTMFKFASQGDLKGVQMLVEHCHTSPTATIYGNTVLHEAGRSGNLELVQWLVQQGANLNAVNNHGETVLHRAARSDNLQLVQWLVQRFVNRINYTVLHDAAKSGNLKIVQWLVQQGADLREVDNIHGTVLHKAARSGNLELVQWLVQQGADPRAADNFGYTVLDHAYRHSGAYLYLYDVINNLNRAAARQAQPTRKAQKTNTSQKPTSEMYTLALLKNDDPDPKRPGNDYTRKEFGLASSMLQGVPQNQNAYLAELEKVFSLGRALKLFEDITTDDDHSSDRDSPPDEGGNASK